jgi:hypothetical protein
MGEGISPEQADGWCDAWEAEAFRRGIGGSGEFWEDGRRWIEEQRLSRKAPPELRVATR